VTLGSIADDLTGATDLDLSNADAKARFVDALTIGPEIGPGVP